MALDEAVRLASAGHDLHMAVNISAVQLTDPHVADVIVELLHARRLDPSALRLEVTESAVMAELRVASATLERVADHGVDVVIDDFGTGYSSIARLGELPVTGLKIDRRFTTRLGSTPGAERVFGAITDLAHGLNLHVVAEGVETQSMLETVRAFGCEGAQGYFLARPVPGAQLLGVLGVRGRARSATGATPSTAG
jgi:EAL domain-containing protein (putative c-di-GMP-specific phosphodiesterase class I)